MTSDLAGARPERERSLEAVAARMHEQNLTRMIVTRSDGTLRGALRAEDIEPRHNRR